MRRNSFGPTLVRRGCSALVPRRVALLEAFRLGLREHGYIERENISIDVPGGV